MDLRNILTIFTFLSLATFMAGPACALEKNLKLTGKRDIVIDSTKRTLTLFIDGKQYSQYPVAVGKYDTPTPIGNFQIIKKSTDWGGGFGSRWLGLNVPWGIYGIHGTNKPHAISSYASHGCIRMHNESVKKLYPLVTLNTRVIIIGNPFSYQETDHRVLRRDFRGADVFEVQRKLKRLGYYKGPLDGIWGWGMEESVINFRKAAGLPRDNAVGRTTYQILGL